MKYFLNILVLLFVLVAGIPQEASASCCSSEKMSCSTDADVDTNENNHHETPCGSSCCDCICCGSISFLLSKKSIPEVKVQVDFSPPLFSYKSLKGTLFHSTIWQPPRLG